MDSLPRILPRFRGPPRLAQRMTGDANFRFHETDHASSLPLEQSHLIEADADRRAAWRIADEVLSGGLMLNVVSRDQLTVSQLLEGWSMVNAAVFWLLASDDTHDQVVGRSLHHPHPEVRFWFTFARFEGYLKQKSPELVETYHADVRRSFKTLRSLWQLAGRPGRTFTPDSGKSRDDHWGK